ncbi:hypothetical protein [Paracoccus aminophilus]|uniref:hypothetical protein n=1 Tax=Paracoccus aminophilus TaxID=34003 RepID=UPI000420B69E|nr:hypothetical protein [Paracoccus aminophilus]
MSEIDKVSVLDAEIQLRKRTIIFLISEYASRHESERGKIIAFLNEVIPDMAVGTAAIAQEILNEIQKS